MKFLKNILGSMLNVIKTFCKILNAPDKNAVVTSTSCINNAIGSAYKFGSSNPSVHAECFYRQHQPTKKCVILVPCNSSIEHKTDEALRILETRGYEVWRTPGWSAIDQGRNRMAYDAIYRRGFDEVLWIDSDILFDPNDVDRIRSWGKDIVAGAYPMKGWPVMTVQPLYGKTVEFKEDGGLEEVMCAATGFLFIKRVVFDTIKEKLSLPECNTSFSAPQIPFFQPDMWTIEGEKYYLGEDFSFCMRARQCGFQVLLDTGIKLGHIGKYTYEWEDVINKTGMNPKLNGMSSNFVYGPFFSNKGGSIK